MDLEQPEDKHKKRQKWLEIGVFFVALAMLISLLGLATWNKKIVQKVELREKRVSSFIEELGVVRQENIHLQEKLENQAKNIHKFVSVLQASKEDGKEESGGSVETGCHGEQCQDVTSQSDIFQPRLAPPEKAPPSLPSSQAHILIAGHHQKLTDTMIVASFDRDRQKVNLLSIPRDLSVNGRKLNEYYFSYGPIELKNQIEKVTDLEISHYVVISMEAFQKLIDALQGIDIEVEKPLSDSLFPNDRGGVEPFSISAGKHHMDGVLALKYARSRTGTSDFDRASRQQKIIEAVFRKAKEMNFLKDLALTKKVYESIGSLFETNLGFLDMLLFMEQFQNANLQTGNVLSTSNVLLPSRNLQSQYILLPRKGDFSEIHKFIQELL